MLRVLRPELLDLLPDDHPEARRSRRDLKFINRWMGNWRWLDSQLASLIQPGDRILEIGAGDGAFQNWWRTIRGELPCELAGLDIAPRPPTWPPGATWHRTDLAQFDGYADYQIVVSNLTLHHLDDARLRELGGKLRAGPRVVLACEPARSRRVLWGARILGVTGIGRVTRHDAVASVAAGFRADELPQLLQLGASEWDVSLSHSHRGAYRMIAVRSTFST